MGSITLDAVTKEYTTGQKAVDSVSLEIAEGEFMVLVGPSGCGKSTLLRMIAGLEEVTDGSVSIGDRDVTYDTPRARNLAMVFQNYALYPHMNVRRNLGFGLKLRKTPKSEITRRVDDVAAILGLGDLLDRKPAQLSGGQRQRVAIGRAMVREPEAFLMDEPLSNLDAKLRVAMRAELAKLHERLGVTTVYVTHDQVEAMTLGTRVAVLRDGVLQQCDTPQEVFRHPVNLFTAAFIGSPSINLVAADISDGVARFAGLEIELPDGCPVRPMSGRVIMGIRPTDMALSGDGTSGLPVISAEVSIVEDLGAQQNLVFRLDAPRVVTDATTAADDGDDAQLLADDRAAWLAQVDDRATVEVGDRVELALRCEHLHAFDVATGRTLTN